MGGGLLSAYERTVISPMTRGCDPAASGEVSSSAPVRLEGAPAYVVKPVDFRSFIDAVRQLGAFWGVVNEPPPGAVHPRG